MSEAPRIDHIGIIVDDLEKAVVRFRQLLGIDPIRRELPDVGLSIAEFRATNIGIELLSYGPDAEFARRTMGDAVGLNHLTLEVENIPDTAALLSEVGLVSQPGFPRKGAHGEVLFFERDEQTGLLFELCCPDAPT